MKKEIYTQPVSAKEIQITGKFWKDFMEKARTQVIPYQWEALNDRIPGAEPSYWMHNFQVASGKKEGEFGGCVFQDSDGAKWIEAVAFSLMWHPDSELESLADGAIDEIVAAQQPDGYLDTYYIITGLDKRFTNLKDNHELYCLGHMLEAAVAYYDATGKDKLLQAMIRYVDLVDQLIGPEEGKLHGYPGHEVIELALVKLYKITRDEKHLRLAKYFIDQRGQEPLFFQEETEKHHNHFHWKNSPFQYHYYQAGEPVRDQQHAIGHAVRAVYLYAGMADVARETGDETLMEACNRLWMDITHRQMYITGAIGATEHGESFTYDYDLPNDTVYAETCASIGLTFFAQRMLNMMPDAEYADIIEKNIYNGIISGMSYDGKSFFYVNPLEVVPEASEKDHLRHHIKVQRQKWFGCACCPPNLARLLTSLGEYSFSKEGDRLFIHMFMEGKLETKLEAGEISLGLKTNYPWEGVIAIQVNKAPSTAVQLAIRIPGWCQSHSLKVNGAPAEYTIERGYAYLTRAFKEGETIELTLDMPVVLVEANPRVRENIGKIAVMRGPVVYCLEETDNGRDLHRLYANKSADAYQVHYDENFFGGAVRLTASGRELCQNEWNPDALYQPVTEEQYREKTLHWIPYYLWANRDPGEMMVWVHA